MAPNQDSEERLRSALADRYRIEREIGSGGMATVYLADDLKHERKVALKVLKPELAAVVGAERFLAEIKVTANLKHPHILPLFDSGEADGFLFYVMPYLDGESLRDRLDREKQLPVVEAVRIATAVANALDHAHRHKVIHRDIKPANILLQDGEPVVADFGIALAVGAAAGNRLTETGLSLGTPYYMSPEQATGDQPVGPETDTYALGCVLYEMLVGDPPYQGSTAQAVLGKIIAGKPVSATEQRPSIPVHVDAAICCALEKLPADRFTSAQGFVRALGDEHFRYGVVAGSGAAAAGPWNRLSISLAALAILLTLFFGWSLVRPTPAPPVQRFSLAINEGQVPNEWLVLSPDGSALVMAYPNATGQRQLFLRRWGDLTANPISGTEGATDPILSPDGGEVAFFGGSQLKVAPLQGGLVRVLADSASCCVRWGVDGFLYYSASDLSIRRVPASGGRVEQITDVPNAGDGQHAYFQILPGGEVGVFSVFGGGGRIEAMDMASGQRVVLTQGFRSYVTPTGHLVFATVDGRLLAAPFDEKAMELASAPVPLVENLGIRNEDPMYSLSSSGDLVYWQMPGVTDGQKELVWVTRSGEVSPVDPDWTGEFESVELSPDGNRLVATVGVERETDLWIKELDRGPVSLLTFTDGLNRRPTWTSDGLSVTFITGRGDNRDLYVKRVDGIGSAEVLRDLAVNVDEGFWAPDGDWLIYRTGISGEERDIFAWRSGPDSATVPVAALPGVDEVAPALSPNGQWLAYVSNETGRQEVWVRPFPDVTVGRRQISVQGGTEPVWAHSGQELFYKSQGNLMAVDVQTGPTFTTGEVRQLFSTEGYYPFVVHHAYDVTEDDERFLMIRLKEGEGAAELILVQNFFEELKDKVGG